MASGTRSASKDKSKKSKKKQQADKADRYELYLRSVQAPDVDVRFFHKTYKRTFGHKAKVLREDFCGTAAICCEWVKLDSDKTSYGVDLDPEPLKWGTARNMARLNDERRERVHLLEGDVRTTQTPKADILAAQNFSYCIFTTRESLRDYFARARENLNDEGILILDLFGGYESIEDDREEVTDHGDFEYVWDQARFDPITNHGTYHIHFRFPDGSEMDRAFSYDWRLWSIPEVRELVMEAGFDEAHVYWEGTDPDSGEGTGVFKKANSGDCDPAWNAYIVGVKKPRSDV